MRTDTMHGTPRAFSLIEMLVVITIISILTSILVPALSKAQVTSRRTLALANARTLATTYEAYLSANRETYPFIAPTEEPSVPGERVVAFKWWPEGTLVATTDLFTLEWAWPALITSVTPWQEGYPTWVSPGRDTTLPEEIPDFSDEDHPPEELVSWRVSSAFLGDPAIWNPDRPGDDPRLVRAVRAQEVTFPSSKVLAWDTHLAYLRREPDLREGHWDAPAPMCFADAHADARNPLDARPGVANSLRGGDDRRLHNTANGVQGVDY